MELYHHPATEFVAGFIGAPSMNFLDIRADGGRIAYGGHAVGAIAALPGAVRLGIRPEHLGIVAQGMGGMDARVDLRESLGGDSYLYVSTGQKDRIVVRADGDTTLDTGAVIGLILPPARVHQFGMDGRTLRSETSAA
jgi:ABC-type sugar transport system ATPase subunit